MSSKYEAILSTQKLGYVKYLSKKKIKPFFTPPPCFALFNYSFEWPMSLMIKYEKDNQNQFLIYYHNIYDRNESKLTLKHINFAYTK